MICPPHDLYWISDNYTPTRATFMSLAMSDIHQRNGQYEYCNSKKEKSKKHNTIMVGRRWDARHHQQHDKRRLQKFIHNSLQFNQSSVGGIIRQSCIHNYHNCKAKINRFADFLALEAFSFFPIDTSFLTIGFMKSILI
jgi:hypothetical protein